MLVDRSLRSMAALMTVFAFVLIIIIIVYAPLFSRRPNKKSTSIGSPEPESCDTMESRNIVCQISPSQNVRACSKPAHRLSI
jgi:hypothetical protein